MQTNTRIFWNTHARQKHLKFGLKILDDMRNVYTGVQTFFSFSSFFSYFEFYLNCKYLVTQMSIEDVPIVENKGIDHRNKLIMSKVSYICNILQDSISRHFKSSCKMFSDWSLKEVITSNFSIYNILMTIYNFYSAVEYDMDSYWWRILDMDKISHFYPFIEYFMWYTCQIGTKRLHFL